ncbi:flagellar hook-basal body protein [Lachnospiraceae bacterium XBB1006]|nr:flagellar hook-basal body protein [Lachnospiraceae bacterium XBB1006]
MMRSLYSGVAGLKTHQTKMDVIGNNIANVNTVAFKSTSVTFNEIYYQTTQSASGPSASTGVGGVNAKQIGLGVAMASTMTNIKQQGATQTTGGAFDIKINGNSFFVVNDGTKNLFTRAGSFYVDAAGNLAMTSTGYNVMGWQVDKETGIIKKDTVSALRVMQASNMTSAPEATTKAVATGVLDANAKATKTDAGYIMNLNFFDALGYQYTAKFKVQDTDTKGTYKVALTDVLDSNSQTVITGNVTTGDLFGVADPNAMDQGALLAGRDFHGPAIEKDATSGELKFTDGQADAVYKEFFNTLYNDTTQTAAPGEIKVIGDDGNEVADKVVLPFFITNQSNGKMVDSGYYYADADGKLYVGIPEKDDTGAVTKMTYVALGCKSDEYEQNVSSEKLRLRQLLQNNFAGIDSNIFIDGNSRVSNKTSYYDELTLSNGYKFTSVSPYRLVQTGDAAPYKYTIMEGESVYKDDLELKDLGNYFKDPKFFKTNAPDTDSITKAFEDIVTGSVTLDKFEKDLKEVYTLGIKGTSYYNQLKFNPDDGKFVSIGNADTVSLALKNLGGNFENIDIDFTQVTNYNNKGSSTMGLEKGDINTDHTGKKLGSMTGISIDKEGMIFGSYDNGNTVLLGQIAVANFANASGLEKVGENCYDTTLNSGEFDGIGVEVSADGGSMTTGALEMSNVDLSNEFTDMITTQRGFQANSRIITTSDTLLEELINLKR